MAADPFGTVVAYVWRPIQLFALSRSPPSAYRRAIDGGTVFTEWRAIRTDTQITSAAGLYIFTVDGICFLLRKSYGPFDLFCDRRRIPVQFSGNLSKGFSVTQSLFDRDPIWQIHVIVDVCCSLFHGFLPKPNSRLLFYLRSGLISSPHHVYRILQLNSTNFTGSYFFHMERM